MSQGVILIVEDDNNLREALVESVKLAGFDCIAADNGKSAFAAVKAHQPNIIITDVQMSEMNGFELLKTLQLSGNNIPIILMTAYGDVNGAVRAMREGAVDYIQKPFKASLLIEKIASYIRTNLNQSITPIAEDEKSIALLEMAGRVANSDATVLVCGESGTGKEVLARYIHDQSSRRDKPFVAINCAAIPENMLEATLFGYEKGAFTGAYKTTVGKFELANSGTILLDEISEMSLPLQAKLLRVLQEKEVERLGGNKLIKLDVRVVATTNREMATEVKEKRFREDLYYRINVFPLQWRPLRDRTADILPLANIMLTKYKVCDRENISLSEAAEEKLLAYQWPGNTRELENVMQRALILQKGNVIQAEDLQIDCASDAVKTTAEQRDDSVLAIKANEQDQILAALKNNQTRKEIAERLGISTRTLRYKLAKMREAGIELPRTTGTETV